MGISISAKAQAIVDQMEAMGVDLLAPQVEFSPDAWSPSPVNRYLTRGHLFAVGIAIVLVVALVKGLVG